MYRRSLAVALLGMAVMTLGTFPAVAASNDLSVRHTKCMGVTVLGANFPANQRFFLVARYLSTGGMLGGKPIPIRTSTAGTIKVHVDRDLHGVDKIDVSIWMKQANTLVMTARDRVNIACSRSARLPMTGSARSLPELLLALLLMASGAALVWWNQPRVPTV